MFAFQDCSAEKQNNYKITTFTGEFQTGNPQSETYETVFLFKFKRCRNVDPKCPKPD